MPFIEYMLLAMLGSVPVAGGAPARTITAEAIIQPNGAALGDPIFGQKKPTTGKKPLEHARSSRHHRRGRSHGKVTRNAGTGKKPAQTGN